MAKNQAGLGHGEIVSRLAFDKVTRVTRLIIAVFSIATLISASALGAGNAESVESGVKITYDKFKKETSYDGPAIRIMSPGDYYWHKIFLRAYKKNGGVASGYQIYVETHYTAPRYISYSHAYDDQGTKLSLSKIDRDVNSCKSENECLFEEVYAINVSKAYLQKRAKLEEAEFKVEGNGDDMTFSINGSYIQGFLNAVQNKKPN